MKVCPKCGNVISFNSYFGGYICDECEWEDASYFADRVIYFSNRKIVFEKAQKQYEEILEMA